MKKIKLLSIVSTLLIGSSLSIQAPVAEASVMSGANCESANLTQALAGMGWSQAGVANNATSSFFTVCGVTWNFGDLNNETVSVLGVTTGTIECTLRTQNFTDGSFVSAAITITDAGTGRGFASATMTGLAGPNITLVCALDPGEKIEGYWTDF